MTTMRRDNMTGLTMVLGALAFALAACSSPDEPRLMQLRASDGPDEFSILPAKALTMPEDLRALPAPTPGGANRTDPTPEADAIVALGGNPGAAGGIPAADAALHARATRMGTDANIRPTLAAEDLEWRRDNRGRLLERLFGTNVYPRAYRKMALDQYGDLAHWRERGLATPSAPPESVMTDR